MSAKPAIAVLGTGAWGTALAVLAARNGYPVRLWGKDPARLDQIARTRTNAHALPGVELPKTVEPCADLSVAARESHHFLIAVPSHAFREILTHIKPHLVRPSVIAWATKGLAPGGGNLLSDVAADVLPDAPSRAVISGPTFAGEIAKGLPAALTVASTNAAVAEGVAAWLRNERVR